MGDDGPVMSVRLLLAACLATYDPIFDEATGVCDLDVADSRTATTTASVANGDDFGNASWTKNQVTVTVNQDGVADKVEVAVAATSSFVSSALTSAQNSTFQVPLTLTVMAKFVDVQWLVIESRAATAANQTFFDIQNGVIGTNGASHSGATISAADGSGYRTLSVTVNANGGTNIFRIYLSTADVTITVPVPTTNVLLKTATATQLRCSGITNRKTGVAWTNASATTQPGYEATGVGGKPCIHGYQVQQMISGEAAVVAAFATDAAHTLFYIVDFDNADLSTSVFGVGNSGFNTSRTRAYGTGITGTGRHNCACQDDAAANFNVQAGTDMVSPTDPKVVEWFTTGTAMSCQDNGGAAAPNAASQDSGTITHNQCGILVKPDSAPDMFAACRLARVLVFASNLSAARRSRVRVAIAGSRGITVTP